MNLNEKPVW